MEIQNDILTIQIEFPWSLTNAVKERFPKKWEGVTNEAFQELIKQYVAEAIELKEAGELIQASKITILNSGESSHHLNIELNYPITHNGNLTVKNTALFNTIKKPKNFHRYTSEDGQISEFITQKDQPEFTIERQLQSNFSMAMGLPVIIFITIIGIVILAFIVYNRTNKITNNG